MEMKFRTSFTKKLAAKAISLIIKKKTGYKVRLNLEDLDIRIKDDVAHVTINCEAWMNINELKKIENVIDSEMEAL